MSLGLRTWVIWGTITHGTKPAEAWNWVVESYESPQQLGVILPHPHPKSHLSLSHRYPSVLVTHVSGLVIFLRDHHQLECRDPALASLSPPCA